MLIVAHPARARRLEQVESRDSRFMLYAMAAQPQCIEIGLDGVMQVIDRYSRRRCYWDEVVVQLILYPLQKISHEDVSEE